MSTLYLDQVGGVSGDMFLAALIDLGLDPKELTAALEGLKLGPFHLHVRRVTRRGLDALNVIVHAGGHETPGESAADSGREPHHHHGDGAGHSHTHPHRGFTEIAALIQGSELPEAVKQRSVAVFRRLGEAEAAVHQVPLDRVHFHEVGAVDSIVDIVGVCWGLDRLGVTRLVSSPFVLGRGIEPMAHGAWPVPAPATLRLIEGFASEFTTIEGETVTPTGAALVTELAQGVGMSEPLTPRRVGVGAGQRDWRDRPNVLRAILGESESCRTDQVEVLETAIDDSTPQVLAVLGSQLLALGALDVYWTAVSMKKGRMGALLTVLCPPGGGRRLAGVIFCESTTLGIRTRTEHRWILPRRAAQVATPWGVVGAKLAELPDGKLRQIPEFDDCLRVAAEAGVPVAQVLEAARSTVPVGTIDPGVD